MKNKYIMYKVQDYTWYFVNGSTVTSFLMNVNERQTVSLRLKINYLF